MKKENNIRIIDVKSYNEAMDALNILVNIAENKKYERNRR